MNEPGKANQADHLSDLIETIASYVPGLIIERLARDPTPINVPSSERFPAAVLFADISGFTVLAERLAQRGPAGAEELTHLLNTYFSQLIELIAAAGGDIAKFAGDALIALWFADESSPAVAVRRAAHCAHDIQHQLDGYEVAPGVRLSLKLALGAGDVLSMHLGGVFGRWEFLITGDPIVQVGLAEQRAGPGDVVLSAQSWALLGEIAEGVSLADGFFRLRAIQEPPLPEEAAPASRLIPEMEEGLRAYIPGAILARLAAGQSGWLAELRRVTVLFVNLPDLDYTMPVEQAQAVMQTLQTTLYHYEGSINKLSVDDKGVSLIAALGLPPLAHEDDPLRGVQAALDMKAELRRMGLQCAIGVTTGRAFCGTVGNAQRREYTMIGHVVNLAARLMQAAPEDILCDAATYQATDLHLDFAALSPIKIKGSSEPVTVYRPLGQKEETAARQTNIVGRQAERSLLQERLQALQAGRESIIIIEGEAGIGKSRLAEDMLRRAWEMEITSLTGAGIAVDQSTPYHAWRPIFRQLFRLETVGDDLIRQRTFVLAQLEEKFGRFEQPLAVDQEAEPSVELEGLAWWQLVPLLNAVLPLDWPENELTEQMSGKVRADNTQEFLVRVLRQTVSQAETPYLILLEDAHWLDSASWALTLHMARRVRPVLLVIATRPLSEPLPTEYRQLNGLAYQLELQTLPVEATESLVCHRLGVASVPPSLLRLIYTKAEGNPFFSEELAYALRDAGLIRVVDGECRIAPEAGDFQELDLPDTIQGIITSRIDRLSPSQQLTLKVASVIGRIFELGALRYIHPIEADKPYLLEYLDALAQLDITRLETPEPTLSYIFKHIITQEVAYNLLLFAQRRALHRAVADWLERNYTADLSPFYPLLAYHWQAADEVAKAMHYFELAGEQALHNYANEEAVEFFSQALTLAKKEESTPALELRRGRWELKLGEAYINWAKLSEGRVYLEQGLTRLGFPPPTGQTGLPFNLARQVFWQAWCRLGPACRPNETPALLLQAAQAYEGLTAVYYFANETLLSLYAAFRSLNLAEAAGPSPELARGYASVGVIVGFVPLHKLARAYCRWALDMARRVDNLPALAWVSLLAGVYHAGVGCWSLAHDLLGEALEISERLGDHSRWSDAVGNLATVYYFQGRVAESARLYDDLFDEAERRDDRHNQAWAVRGQIYCLLLRREFTQARHRLQTLQSWLSGDSQIVDEDLKIDLYGLLALVHLRLNEPEAALAAARQALRLTAHTSPTSYLSLPGGYAGVAETFLVLWEQGFISRVRASRADIRRACRLLRGYSRVFPIGQPQTRLWQGVFEWQAGRRHLARELWRQAVEAAQQLGMPHIEASIHYEIGQRINGPAREEHLRQAEAIFSRLDLY